MSGDQYSFDGFPPSDEERQEAKRILDSRLSYYLGVGPENAVTTKRLAERLFTTERAITLAVYAARRAGVPVCSNQRGFFLPRSESDVIACVMGMANRSREIAGSAKAIYLGWYAGWRPSAERVQEVAENGAGEN